MSLLKRLAAIEQHLQQNEPPKPIVVYIHIVDASANAKPSEPARAWLNEVALDRLPDESLEAFKLRIQRDLVPPNKNAIVFIQ